MDIEGLVRRLFPQSGEEIKAAGSSKMERDVWIESVVRRWSCLCRRGR